MVRAARAIAIVLTLAFAAVPLVADWCAARCEAPHADAGAAVPACHHAASTTFRIGHPPAPCGQGHQPMVVNAAAISADTSHAAVALAAPPTALASHDVSVARLSRAGPPTELAAALPLALSASLRV